MMEQWNNRIMIKNPWLRLSDIQILSSKKFFMEHARQEVFKTWLIKNFYLKFEYAWHKICFTLEPVESVFHAFPDSPPPLKPC
jgi:hypothetical protein